MTSTAAPSRPTRRSSALDRHTADHLAATEYERFAALLTGLTVQQWQAPTRCPGWDVRAVAAHCLGMAEMITTTREMMRQNIKATARSKRRGDAFIDALTGLQVEEHAAMNPDTIVARYTVAGPRAARSRAHAKNITRAMSMPGESFPGDVPWTMGYLWDTILTRDPWMHRVDITDATGTPMMLTADHDGVLVDDVVREWAARHAQPCHLVLTGPAGGRWAFGGDGPEMTYDAIDFCRRISGRAVADDLLTTQVPF